MPNATLAHLLLQQSRTPWPNYKKSGLGPLASWDIAAGPRLPLDKPPADTAFAPELESILRAEGPRRPHPDEIQKSAEFGIPTGASMLPLQPQREMTLADRIQEAGPTGNADLYYPMVKPLEPEQPLEYWADSPMYWDEPGLNGPVSSGPMPSQPSQTDQLQVELGTPQVNYGNPQEQLMELLDRRLSRSQARHPTR